MKEQGEMSPKHEAKAVLPLVDSVQDELEAAYSLPRRFRIANFLHPQVTSPMANGKLATGVDNGFFVTDFDLLPPEQRMRRREQKQRTILGRLPLFRTSSRTRFTDLHPVLYFRDRIKNEVAEKENLAALMDTREVFQVFVEEISHFEYSGQQYETNGVLPGYIMGEAIALLDMYAMYKVACRQKGVSMSGNNPVARKAERGVLNFAEKRRTDWLMAKRKIQQKFSSLPPENQRVHRGEAQALIRGADVYIKSVDIMEGYLRHIIHLEREGKDTSGEVGEFYLMPPKDQIDYLKRAYSIPQSRRDLNLLEAAVRSEFEFTI